MNKKILTIMFSVAAFGLAVWAARPGNGATLPTPMADVGGQLQASETKFDFGTIRMADGKVSREIAVTNTGTGPVTVSKLFTSCMCTVAALDIAGKKFGPFGMPGHGYIPRIGAKLEAGTSMQMLVTFDPNAHGPAGVGHIERVVTLEYDDDRTLEVDFSADVTP